MGSFNPEVSVVAGVGPGLGASLAHKFAREGCRVAVLARSSDFVERLRKEIRQQGMEIVAIRADIAEPDQVAAAFERIRKELGPVDVLINNASASSPFSHVAHVVIDGVIQETEYDLRADEQIAEPLMNPAAIADAYWRLVKQDRSAWSLEIDLRPFREKFFE